MLFCKATLVVWYGCLDVVVCHMVVSDISRVLMSLFFTSIFSQTGSWRIIVVIGYHNGQELYNTVHSWRKRGGDVGEVCFSTSQKKGPNP